MTSKLTPLRGGKKRPPKHTRRAFRNGEPLPNLLRARSQQKWRTRKNGKLVKLGPDAYAIQRTFSSGKEMRAYVLTVRKLRQYCKSHPFEYAEFTPVYVKTVDAKGNRVLEQAIFAPSIVEVAEGFAGKNMSAYKKLLLRKLLQKKIDPKKISGLALKASMDDLTRLADELFDRRISVNLGDQFSHVLVTDYNPKTGKLVISIAGNVTDPYSIF